MTQRRRIAIAYVFAIPVVLLIVLIQHAALFGVNGFEVGMTQAAEVIREAETVSSLLADAQAEMRIFSNAGGDDAYQSTILQLRAALKQLREHTANDPVVKAKYMALEPLIESKLAQFQRSMDLPRKRELPNRGQDLHAGDTSIQLHEAASMVVDIRAAEQIRLEQQSEAGARSMHLASMLTTYGGGLLIWLVGSAAFLLFHDERGRAWEGVERRVHTKVLEVLPLGVSVATDAGIILYANPAEEDLFRCKRGELVGRHADVLHALDEEEGKHLVNDILEHLGMSKVWSGQLPVRKKDETILKTASWILNMEIAGKVYRIFVHNADWQG